MRYTTNERKYISVSRKNQQTKRFLGIIFVIALIALLCLLSGLESFRLGFGAFLGLAVPLLIILAYCVGKNNRLNKKQQELEDRRKYNTGW
jgi:membrane protein implicated in regulation of membrane protease activity